GKWYVAAYACMALIIQFILGLYAMDRSPGFIVLYQVAILSLPVPVILYALLRKHFNLAVMGFLAFSVFTTAFVNPLYRGTSTLRQTPLSEAIKAVNTREPGTWATEIIYLENFAALSGASARSGVYAYPQLDLWRSADDGDDKDTYNRYAHVNFIFDRDTTVDVKTSLVLTGVDHFDITTEPCGQYMHEEKIRYIVTIRPIKGSCLELVKTVSYPTESFLIYKIN
ncbi:MAG: hypothetical protein AAB834_08165, partial [Patescibacteria group bacterium]